MARRDKALSPSNSDLSRQFRFAQKNDARELTELINFAGEGLPRYLWSMLNDGSTTDWAIGRERAQRETGSFSYRNAVVYEDQGKAAATLIGYVLPDQVDLSIYSEMPAMFVPLQELEDSALSTWYVNVLAAYPEYRGCGIGSQLLDTADQLAQSNECPGLSIIVANTNHGARRLYERKGFREVASRNVISDNWATDAEEWILLIKTL